MSGQQLVDAYLNYLTKAAEPLPEERRTDLVADVRSHIAEAQAAGATSEADVRQMLKQLGDPDDIVAAATDGLVLVDRHRPRFRGRDKAVLFLLPFGGYLLFIGWIVGVILLWTSDRWTRREKWLGTLVVPLGYVPIEAFGTVDMGLSRWVGIPLVVVLALLPVLTFVVLLKNGRPGRSAQQR